MDKQYYIVYMPQFSFIIVLFYTKHWIFIEGKFLSKKSGTYLNPGVSVCILSAYYKMYKIVHNNMYNQ